MIDRRTAETFQRKASSIMEDRGQEISREVARIRNERAHRGNLIASPTVDLMAGLGANELTIRVEILLTELLRIMRAASVKASPTLGDELKALIDPYFPDSFGDLRNPVVEAVGLLYSNPTEAGYRYLWGRAAATLIDARQRALKRIRAEIDVFVLELERQPEAAAGQAPVLQFYGPTGAVLTGSHATAHVFQDLRSDESKTVLNVLETVKERLTVLDATVRPKVADLIDDAAAEAARPHPNRLKIGALLSAIALAVQTFANARPAYEAVKNVLVLLGLPQALP